MPGVFVPVPPLTSVRWQVAAPVATGTILAAGVVEVTVTWPEAFADASYTVVASVEENTTGATGTLRLRRIKDRLAGSARVVVENVDVISHSGFVHAVAAKAG